MAVAVVQHPDLCTGTSFELRVPLPDVVSVQTRQPNLEGVGEIPLRRLVKEALRMRPSRIVVGEMR
jgi:pilus assembly protein CpaF